MTSGPITLWHIDGETMEKWETLFLGGSQITADGDCSHEIKRCSLLGRKAMTNLDSMGSTDAEAEALILWPPDVKSWLIRQDPDAGKDWRQEEKGAALNEMGRSHHWLNGHEFEQTPGDSGGHGRTDVLQFMESQRVGHDLVNEQLTANYIPASWRCED